MKLKRVIETPEVQDIYTVNAFLLGGSVKIAAGPEKDGCSILFDPLTGTTETIAQGPGGVMSIVPVPGREDMLISVMGLFPPFKGKTAGIFRHWKKGKVWYVDKVADLPFAHRCDTILSDSGKAYLVSCSVSLYKNTPDDWSLPGCIYWTDLEDVEKPLWKLHPVREDMMKNHGMTKTLKNGKEVLMISSESGIYEMVPEENGVDCKRVFDKPVSEFAFADFDGDGLDELVCIEPFHGNSMNFYRMNAGKWDLFASETLSFGHGLSAGSLNAGVYVAVGNRGEQKQLSVYSLSEENVLQKAVVEVDSGTTQSQFIEMEGKRYLLAANQMYNKAIIYTDE